VFGELGAYLGATGRRTLPRIRSASAPPIGEKDIAMQAPPPKMREGEEVFHVL